MARRAAGGEASHRSERIGHRSDQQARSRHSDRDDFHHLGNHLAEAVLDAHLRVIVEEGQPNPGASHVEYTTPVLEAVEGDVSRRPASPPGGSRDQDLADLLLHRRTGGHRLLHRAGYHHRLVGTRWGRGWPITASLSASHSPDSPLVTVIKLLPQHHPAHAFDAHQLGRQGRLGRCRFGSGEVEARPRASGAVHHVLQGARVGRPLRAGCSATYPTFRPGRPEFNHRGSPGTTPGRLTGNVASLPPPGPLSLHPG